MTTGEYRAFLEAKAQAHADAGFERSGARTHVRKKCSSWLILCLPCSLRPESSTPTLILTRSPDVADGPPPIYICDCPCPCAALVDEEGERCEACWNGEHPEEDEG